MKTVCIVFPIGRRGPESLLRIVQGRDRALEHSRNLAKLLLQREKLLSHRLAFAAEPVYRHGDVTGIDAINVCA